ncbi:hypothetical protein B0H19DRAFT_1154653 [Mycena capillaripes]|nr:hypothetical protein B0H19DRAFT_1154653 [Mycena capillaripes]
MSFHESPPTHRTSPLPRDHFEFPNSPHHYSGEDGLHLLHSAIATGASYDSIQRHPPPRCHPETRKAVFEIILSWTQHALDGPRVLWAHGEAGSGKSAISQTVSEYFAQTGQLGATFFFCHSKGDLSDGRLLFLTLAYKLAAALPSLRAPLSNAIQANPAILTHALEAQVQKLIIEPFYTIHQPLIPTLVVIDGLDACESTEMQVQILRLIAQLIVVHRLPLCFLITSRLQPHLQAAFDTPVYRTLSTRIPLDVFSSDLEVRAFLRSEFATIQQYHQHTVAGIPDPWPSEEVMEFIVQKCGGQFLYPATVLKYVDGNTERPAERLTKLVAAAASAQAAALSPTDQLYHHVLSTCPDPAALLRILGSLVVLYAPLALRELEMLIGSKPRHVSDILRDMHALVDVPDSGSSSAQETLHIAQPSTMEFLVERDRALQFWIDTGKYHAEIARGCIRYLRDFMDNVEHLDLTLYQYTRRNWTRHLSEAIPSPELLNDLRRPRFLYSRVLFEVQAVIAWLKTIPNSPHDVLRLWENWQVQLQPQTAIYVP